MDLFLIFVFFFFQAEDGIRDLYVTGVQTCALPILLAARQPEAGMRLEREIVREQARRLLDEVAGELAAARQPLATYRIQLHKAFPFDAAAGVLPYLAELGITDLYTSPILQAAPGSMHGYDVIDHGSFNAE